MNHQSSALKDQIFLISGGSSGVGKATAVGLAQKGAKIVIINRDAVSSQRALEEIARRTGNDKGEYLIANLSLQSSVEKLAAEFKNKYSRLNVLANCAGGYFPRKTNDSGGNREKFCP
ncbi:MAG: SDR family NAD(P)-dependent oxidoreductase [Sphingobacteriaceae bacterium]|nr:MAG: SDR family NAD(P)-dependent oxidoreductase [Sphingobacteriaceae bacterium]